MTLSNSITISIIIPTLNEAAHIGNLLKHLKVNGSPKNIEEIIVVDGGSTDGTPGMAKTLGAKIISSEMGRAKQMNKGATVAKGHVLYFLHADTYPPKDFDLYILNAIHHHIASGCFRMKFNTSKRFLRFFAWFSRINNRLCRGGDQSLFVRLYKISKFKVLPQYVITSARKYDQIGTLKLQYHFGIIHLKNVLGVGPEQLYRYYKKNITS